MLKFPLHTRPFSNLKWILLEFTPPKLYIRSLIFFKYLHLLKQNFILFQAWMYNQKVVKFRHKICTLMVIPWKNCLPLISQTPWLGIVKVLEFLAPYSSLGGFRTLPGEKRFYTRGTLNRISWLAKISTLYHDWLRSLN